MRRSRNIPTMIVAVLGGVLVSMLAGLLLASYAVVGVMPTYSPQPAIRQTRIVHVDNVTSGGLTTVQQIAARVGEARPNGREL